MVNFRIGEFIVSSPEDAREIAEALTSWASEKEDYEDAKAVLEDAICDFCHCGGGSEVVPGTETTWKEVMLGLGLG